jgi:hypothetical protein
MWGRRVGRGLSREREHARRLAMIGSIIPFDRTSSGRPVPQGHRPLRRRCGEELGSQHHRRPRGAGGRQRPAVHPRQRHAGWRGGGMRDLCGDGDGAVRSARKGAGMTMTRQ